MKTKILLLATLIFSALPIALPAQMTYVPDDNFEQALINKGLDKPPLNDSIPTKNIDTVTYLNVGLKGITDLTGIEGFRNLNDLRCFQNQLTNLDVSKNQSLRILICCFNKLKSIDISKNSELVIMNCDSNLLTSLDVSKNLALEELYCYYNNLTSINLNNNTNLKLFECWHNELENLDVSNNPALILLSCDDNKLTRLDISKNFALIELNCFNNHLASLDVSQNISLEKLNCDKNQISSLDFKNNPILKRVSCSNNMLSKLDFRNNPNLLTIDCEGNLLVRLEVSKNSKLMSLRCYFNLLSNLDVSKNPALVNLWSFNNPNLFCIQVADSAYSANNPDWLKDPWAHYSENCNYTAVEDNKYGNEAVAISPNPATDYIEINNVIPAEAGIQVRSVTIYNILGEIVVGSETNTVPSDSYGGTIKINIAALPQGTYFIRFNNEIRKFIKY